MATTSTKKISSNRRQSKADKEKYGTLDRSMKRRWIKVLRSGKYKQTTSYLKRDGKFCCLGVLCDISQIGKWQEPAFIGEGNDYEVEGVRDSGSVPGPLARSIGLTSVTQSLLQHFNDDSGWGFRRIATWVEKHL